MAGTKIRNMEEFAKLSGISGPTFLNISTIPTVFARATEYVSRPHWSGMSISPTSMR